MSINLKFLSFCFLFLCLLSCGDDDDNEVIDQNQVTKDILIGNWISISYIFNGEDQTNFSSNNITFNSDCTHDTATVAMGFGINFTGNFEITENGTRVLFRENMASIGVTGPVDYDISELTNNSATLTLVSESTDLVIEIVKN